MSEEVPAHTESPGERPQLLIDSGRYDEARILLQQAIGTHPDDVELWCLLALCEIKADRDADALRAADRAVALGPDEEWPHRLRSLALGNRKEHRDAVAAAREAVRLGPELWQTHSRLAMALSELSFRTGLIEAHNHALHAVHLAPDEPGPHFTLGVIAQERGEQGIAEAAYRTVLSLDPAHPAAMNNLGLLHLRRGRLTDAAEKFTSSIRSDPGFDIARQNVAAIGWRLLSFGYYAALGATMLLRNLVDFGERTYVAPYGVRIGVGVLLLVVLGVLAVRKVRPLPASAKRYLVRLPRTSLGFAVATAGVLVAVAGALFGAFGPAQLAVHGLVVAVCGVVVGFGTFWIVRMTNRATD